MQLLVNLDGNMRTAPSCDRLHQHPVKNQTVKQESKSAEMIFRPRLCTQLQDQPTVSRYRQMNASERKKKRIASFESRGSRLKYFDRLLIDHQGGTGNSDVTRGRFL